MTADRPDHAKSGGETPSKQYKDPLEEEIETFINAEKGKLRRHRCISLIALGVAVVICLALVGFMVYAGVKISKHTECEKFCMKCTYDNKTSEESCVFNNDTEYYSCEDGKMECAFYHTTA